MYFFEASEFILTAAVFIMANVLIVVVVLSLYLTVLKRQMTTENRRRRRLQEDRQREAAFAFHQLYQTRPFHRIRYPQPARDLFLEEDILGTVFLEKKRYGGEGFAHHVYFGTCARCGIPLPSWRQCVKCYKRLCRSWNSNPLFDAFRCDNQEHVRDLLDDRPQCRNCRRSCALGPDAATVV